MLNELTAQLAQGASLSTEQVTQAVAALVDEQLAAETKADFLTALACKGETSEEIAAFARELRAKSVVPPIDAVLRDREILDVCGTGGDRLNTFNISTTVAIVAAAAGVTVAKHGNRAITSQSGSADVLEALGIPIDLAPEDAARALGKHGFAFFFAPRYHPAFKHIAPARKLCAERGQRTIFNFLGPLLNPARPSAQLIGVPRPELCAPLACVLQSLGVRRGMVVSGNVAPLNTCPPFSFESTNRIQRIRVIDMDGKSPPSMSIQEAIEFANQRKAKLISTVPDAKPPIFRLVDSELISRLALDVPEKLNYFDELSTLGDTTIAEFYQNRGFSTSVMSPADFQWQPASLADLAGGDKQANAEIVRRLLRGEERGPKRDAVLLNAGAALFVASRTKSLVEGCELAAELMDSGRAATKLAELAAH